MRSVDLSTSHLSSKQEANGLDDVIRDNVNMLGRTADQQNEMAQRYIQKAQEYAIQSRTTQGEMVIIKTEMGKMRPNMGKSENAYMARSYTEGAHPAKGFSVGTDCRAPPDPTSIQWETARRIPIL